MPKIDIQIDSAIVGILSLDPQDIYAQGGPDFPVLHIRTDFGITRFSSTASLTVLNRSRASL